MSGVQESEVKAAVKAALKEVQQPAFINEVISSSVSANTNIFSDDLEAPEDGYWIIKITSDTAGYPKIAETPSGSGTTVTSGLNEASDLTANAWYGFWSTARKGDKINLQFSAAATVTLRVFFSRSP